MLGSYFSRAVSAADGAGESRIGSTGCCSGVGGRLEEVVAVAQRSGSRGLAVPGDGGSGQVVGGAGKDPDG